jgi:hypothetical protein
MVPRADEFRLNRHYRHPWNGEIFLRYVHPVGSYDLW